MMKISQIANQNLVLNELSFSLLTDLCNHDINCILDKLADIGLDNKTLGFWIVNVKTKEIICSKKFSDLLRANGLKIPTNFDELYKLVGKKRILKTYVYNNQQQKFTDLLCYGGKIKSLCFSKFIKSGFILFTNLTEQGLYAV